MAEKDVALENEIQTSYIDYAMSVIVGRALPDARDGLKPAQRRILYAMYMIKNTHDQPTKKSARIVGETIGRYHPHGDMAAYDALVRMAQDFSMNHTIVEGQGNMGSVDGDPPAAQRYTEVRLERYAEELLVDIEKRPVEFVPNFDNTVDEPVVLPSKIPNLLVNGSSGIAVGVATSILPHNLGEVCDAIIAYIDNHDITPHDLMNIIKGPDFPTGGHVFRDEGLMKSYLTGRGSVTIRANSEVEEGKRGRSIIVTEIPYMVNKSMLLEKIASLVRNKTLTGISSLRDESSKKDIRIVMDLKRDVDPEFVLNILYAHTNLQVSMPVMNIAVIGNRLLTMNIKDFIKVFVDHRIETITNITRYDLKRAQDRLHIVEGIMIAIEHVDDVVETIKGSADARSARENLIRIYDITEKQAEAILEMQLRRLTGIEESTLKDEKNVLVSEIDNCNRTLSDTKYVYQIIRNETEDVKKRYGRGRRSYIEENLDMKNIENEDLIKDEESVVIRTNMNYMKRLPATAYRTQGRGGKGVISIDMREGDYVNGVVTCMSKDYLLIITSKGKAYWLKAYAVPEGNRYSSGKAAVNLVNIQKDENIVCVVNTREFEGKYLVFTTESGKMKRVSAEAFSRPRSNGIRTMPEVDDNLVSVCVTDGDSELFVATKNGKGLRFGENDVRAMGRTAYGVRGIRLGKGDAVVGAVDVDKDKKVVTITERGFGKATDISKYRLQNRGGKGVLNIRVTEKVGKAVKVLACSDDDNILVISSSGISIEFRVSAIRVTGRNASGVKLMSLEPGTSVVDAQIV